MPVPQYVVAPPLFRPMSLLLFLALVSAEATARADSGQTPVELLNKAESYFARFDCFRAAWMVAYGNADGTGRGEERKWEIVKDGLKFKVNAAAEKPRPVDPRIDFSKLPPGAREEVEQMEQDQARAKEFITLPGERNLHIYSPTSLLDEVHPSQATAHHIIGNTPFALSYGYLQFTPLLDRLKSMDLTAEVSHLDGSEVEVLHGTSRDGEFDIRIWFNPALEYVIPKIEYQRQVSTPGVPDRWVETVVLTQSDFQRIDNVLVPRSGQEKVVSAPRPRLDYGKRGTAVAHRDASGNIVMEPEETRMVFYELQSYRYKPALTAADFEPTVPIEEGARVEMMDARRTQYKWSGGKAVPGLGNLPQRPGNMPKGPAVVPNGKPTK